MLRRFAQIGPDGVCNGVSELAWPQNLAVPPHLIELFDPNFWPIGWTYVDGQWIEPPPPEEPTGE